MKKFLFFLLICICFQCEANGFDDQISFSKRKPKSFIRNLPQNSSKVLMTTTYTAIHVAVLPPFMLGQFSRGLIEGRDPNKFQKIIGRTLEIGVIIGSITLGAQYVADHLKPAGITYVSLTGLITVVRCLKSKKLFKQSFDDSFSDNRMIVPDDAFQMSLNFGKGIFSKTN